MLSMKVLTVFLTFILWTTPRTVHSGSQDSDEQKTEEEGEPLHEAEFYNSKFIDLSDPDWKTYKEEDDPLLKAGLFEGDIDLGNISVSQLVNNSDVGKNAIRNPRLRWPKAIVPYSISKLFDVRARLLIARALTEFHQKTCIRFKPRTSGHKDYIYFIQGRGCYSRIGRVGGDQRVSLGKGCHRFGIIVHELIHALGFWHEQSRPDRDDYVTIVWKNIQKGMARNFHKRSWAYMQSLNESYDYESIMHYGPYGFARNKSQPTIIPKIKGQKIGQRDGFSKVDLREINKLYECKE